MACRDGLLAALMAFSPATRPVDAASHVAAARAVSRQYPAFDPELLLALAWVESRWDGRAVAWTACSGSGCRRKRASWRESRFGKAAPKARAGWFCGPLQVHARRWEECRPRLVDVEAGYRDGAANLAGWLREGASSKNLRTEISRQNRRDLREALTGFNGGYRMLNSKKPRRFAGLVQSIEQDLKRSARGQFCPVDDPIPNNLIAGEFSHGIERSHHDGPLDRPD